ncbi:MAG: hypothetical protein Tsb0016_04460 [Sphingomonadales bacterium]
MEDALVPILVPFIVFASTASTVIAYFLFRHRNHVAVQQTLQKAIDGGQALTPEMVQALGVHAAPTPLADLRRAVLFIGFGAGAAIFSQFFPDAEASRAILGVAAFPIMLGIGYGIVYLINRQRQD